MSDIKTGNAKWMRSELHERIGDNPEVIADLLVSYETAHKAQQAEIDQVTALKDRAIKSMTSWECRALKAESEIERLKAELDEIKQEFGRLSYGLVHDEPEWQPSQYTDKAFSKLMDLTSQALEGNQ